MYPHFTFGSDSEIIQGLRVVLHTCNPSTQEEAVGEARVQDQPGLHETLYNCFKQISKIM